MAEPKRVTGIRCPHCWDCIYSASVHDFRSCFCGYCFVDGGRDYLRYGWGDFILKNAPNPPSTLDDWNFGRPKRVYIKLADYVRGGLR